MPNGSTHFFRFTAVDIAGNESDPSDEQSAVGNLVDTAFISDAAITEAKIENLAVTDAKIATLSAGKITAGTVAGQEITVGVNSSDTAVIKSSNYSSGSAGWIIKADGTIEANTGNFRGDITGASGTFSGALSAATGTFSGNLSAAGGTFSGDLSAAGGTFTGTLSGVDGSFSGNISANQVTADTLNLSRIPSGIQAKIDSLGIDAGKIANGAVEAAKIAAGAVITDKLADGSVTNAKIDTINANKITAGTMSADRISGGTINGTLIGGGSINMTFNITTSMAISASSGNITNALNVGSLDSSGTVEGSQFKHGSSNSVVGFGSSDVYLRSGGTTDFAAGNNNVSYQTLRPSGYNSKDLGASGFRGEIYIQLVLLTLLILLIKKM